MLLLLVVDRCGVLCDLWGGGGGDSVGGPATVLVGDEFGVT